MTPDEIARLRAVAEAATPGPWSFCTWKIFSKFGDIGQVYSKHNLKHIDNAKFIATFNPSLVLRLLDLAQHEGVMRETLATLREHMAAFPEAVSKCVHVIDHALAQREDDKVKS